MTPAGEAADDGGARPEEGGRAEEGAGTEEGTRAGDAPRERSGSPTDQPIHAVLVPSSLTMDADDPKLRTYKVGQVARALAIHRIREVVVFGDPAHRDDAFVATVLAYAECPPYLRKVCFPMRDELSHAGVLPPLNTPHHKAGQVPRVGDVREGFATEHGVEVGADRPAEPVGRVGEGRVTVEVVGRERGRFLVAARRGPPPAYWGYDVRRADGLLEAMEGFDHVVATSRTGDPSPRFRPDESRGRIAVAFGSPARGLEAILADAGADRTAIPRWVDAVPGQGVASIRTEEAVLLSLEPLRKLLVGARR